VAQAAAICDVSPMTRQIALLRGINLGARNRVSMPELRSALGKAGYEDVRTLLQSGNVVLSSEGSPDAVARELEALVADAFGVESRVVVRSRDQLGQVVQRNPLAEAVKDPKRFQVSFLSAAPDPEIVRELTAREFAPEQVAFLGEEVYAWHPGGLQRSPLARLLDDRRLGVTATARNWNTVTKLLALADEG